MAKNLVQEDDDLCDRIAQLALSHYNTTLPSKGKPKPDSEWTVFAAIVAISDDESTGDDDTDDAWVVSSATGTKCCPIPSHCQNDDTGASLCILRDSHAESLARRGLVRVLAQEVQQQHNTCCCNQDDAASGDGRRLLERAGNDNAPAGFLQLRSNVSLHLYISDSPCGDASIYDLLSATANADGTPAAAQFTGAKVIVSDESNVSLADCGGGDVVGVWNQQQLLAREVHEQLLGKVRSKAGRSNLPPALRSRSMSCSDKLVRWSVLGLQGALLQQYIPKPIRLTTIVIGEDARSAKVSNKGTCCCSCQLLAAHRITERVVAVQHYLQKQKDGDEKLHQSCESSSFVDTIMPPAIHLSKHTFAAGKSSAGCTRVPGVGKKRKRVDRVSPAGLSINWQCTTSPSEVELTVGARGIRQGKKPRIASDFVSLHSRLSRHALLQVLPVNEEATQPRTTADYVGFKRHQRDRYKHLFVYEKVRESILHGGPLAGWLIGDAAADPLSHTSEVQSERSASAAEL